MNTLTRETIASFCECKAALKAALDCASDRKLRQLIRAEVVRLDRAISYLYQRGRR